MEARDRFMINEFSRPISVLLHMLLVVSALLCPRTVAAGGDDIVGRELVDVQGHQTQIRTRTAILVVPLEDLGEDDVRMRPLAVFRDDRRDLLGWHGGIRREE